MDLNRHWHRADEQQLNAAPPPRRRFLIIHNPIAGMRRRWMLREVCRHLRAAGAELTITHADSLEADRRIASDAVQSGAYDAVIAAGGDSTVRGVAAGLVGSQLPLGIIPVGTGNVLAHEVGMRHGPRAVARYLLKGPAIPVTTGSANGTPFCLMAGAGFDARVLARLDTGWKRRMGKLAYIWPVISELATRQPVFEAWIDGRSHQCTWLVVTKVSHYGGPFKIARNQHVQSESFKAVAIRAQSGLGMVGAMLAIALGRADRRDDVEMLACHHVVIPGGQDLGTQLDGEFFAPPPLDIGMGREPLRLIVPPNFQPATRTEVDETVPKPMSLAG